MDMRRAAGRRAALAVATAGVALLAACGSSTPAAAPTDAPTAATPSATQPTAAPQATTPTPTPSRSSTTAAPSPTSTRAPGSGSATPTSPAPASTGLPARLLGRDWSVIPDVGNVVALTFDGGANANAAPAILRTLSSAGIRATFFVTGDFAQRYPDIVQQIAAAGHVIGNHSMTHPEFTALTAAQTQTQLADAAAAIGAAGGGDPQPWFRFPFGDRDATTIARVNDLGYLSIGWTTDTLGWQGTSGGRSVDSVVRRVVDGAQPGQIVLLHMGSHPQDGSTLDADALPRIIAELRTLGYGFTTVEAFLG